MLKKYLLRSPVLFWVALTLFSLSLIRMDRIHFKHNDSFNIRYIQPCLPVQSKWDVPPPTTQQLADLDRILAQPFYYLAKGAHTFAFASRDGRYVIKFHRYPSHMRIMSWINHPFAYHFNNKRIHIREYNFKKLDYNLSNYKNSFEHLQEETGLIYVHTNRTNFLNRWVTIIDKTGNTYHVPLDQVTFLLQHRADLLYSALDKLKQQQDIASSKKIISAIIHLFVTCCQKGYTDQDPILRKNYGIIEEKAIHIDVGDMVYCEEVKERKHYIAHVKEMTASLKVRLIRDYPYLLDHYEREIANL